jgi:opacity protein-like surface antigen
MVRYILAALVVTSASSAPAQDAPKMKWYVSADAGNGTIGGARYAYGESVAPRDGSSMVFRVRGGYQFIRYFALEAAYVNLGSYSSTVDMNCSAAPQVQCMPDFRSDIDMQALGAFGVGTFPLGDRLTVRATVGLSLREKQTHQIPVGAPDYSRTSHSVMGGFGFGAGWAVTKKLEVYAEWNRYDGDGGSEFPTGEPRSPGTVMEEGDIRVFSLGARWRF